MVQARLKVFGWGREGEGMTAEEEAFALTSIVAASVSPTFPASPRRRSLISACVPRASPRRPPSCGSARRNL
jgi:hypothetical protein